MSVSALLQAKYEGRNEEATRRRDVVKALLDRGADVNARQHGGWTPIHAAANNGDAEVAALLLAAGADPRAANDEGQTALDLAAAKGHGALLAALSVTTRAEGERTGRRGDAEG